MNREIKFQEAILEATDQLIQLDPMVYIMGLGVPDPKGVFGTTLGLAKKYGPERVLDMPTSENAMTGIGTGSAILGMRPIMTHQRIDFFLLALDQLINNASKWHYMFGGQMTVPMVIRLIVGRGWGQGPQHSQSLHSLFAHIPGLKVVVPSNPYDAKGLLVSAVEDPNPVVYIEHRWLHNIFGDVPSEIYRVPIGKAKIIQEGSDLTVVASSHMSLEAYRAVQSLKDHDLSIELIDLRSIKPIDKETILQSVRKTGKLIVVDQDCKTCGFSAEILAFVTEEAFSSLKRPPIRITLPDQFCPTSWALSNHYYPTTWHIASEILKVMNKPSNSKSLLEELLAPRMNQPMDIPFNDFKGPF